MFVYYSLLYDDRHFVGGGKGRHVCVLFFVV